MTSYLNFPVDDVIPELSGVGVDEDGNEAVVGRGWIVENESVNFLRYSFNCVLVLGIASQSNKIMDKVSLG